MLSHPGIAPPRFLTVSRTDGLLQVGLQARTGADEDPSVGVSVLSVGRMSRPKAVCADQRLRSQPTTDTAKCLILL